MSLVFGHSELWPLLFAASIPLLLHLLDRRRARVVEWPAMRFFLVGTRRELRWLRWRDALLVTLRTVTILAIVVLFLDPERKSTLPVRSGSGHYRALAIVLDTSSSLRARSRDASRAMFEEARAHALALAATLRPGDALVVVEDSTPDDSRPDDLARDPFDLELARERIRKSSATGTPFDLVRSLDRARAALEELPLPVREIVILSDFPADLEETELEATPAREIAVSLWPARELGARNALVHALRSDGLPADTDRPARILVEICGPHELLAASRLRWWIGDSVIDEHPLQLEPPSSESWTKVELVRELRIERAGRTRVRAELVGAAVSDAIPDDNGLQIAIEVRDRINVVLVGTSRDVGYLDLALSPTPNRATTTPGRAPSSLRPVRLAASDASDWTREAVVVLDGVTEVSPRLAARLDEHVRSGGGLLVFAGPDLDVASWNTLLYRRGLGVLPARIEARQSRPLPDDTTRLLGRLVAGHPVLNPFAADADGGLRRISFRARRALGEPAAGSEPFAWFDDESPWLIARERGAGRVVLATTSSDARDSDLPRTPLYLPLVHRLVQFVAEPANESARAELSAENVEEARLELADDARVARIASMLGAHLASGVPEAELDRTVSARRPLWPIAVGVALCGLLGELGLARTFARARLEGRRRREQPRKEEAA